MEEDITTEELIELKGKLKKILAKAPDEDDCSDIANDMFADMQNLCESIDNVLENN